MIQNITQLFFRWMLLFVAFAFVACKDKSVVNASFDVLESDVTGLDFVNKLTPTDSFNLFDYMYYYNGGGVGAGDFNNDGNIDLFFAANQSPDKIFLNEGGLKFRDITIASQIPQDKGWSTGVSVVDINNDGWLDIYVSRVGNYKVLKSKNQFLICQGLNAEGIPVYKDMALQLGLDYSGFGTQAAFADFDMDGDLDVFLLNHSVHENGVYRPRHEFLGHNKPSAGARLYRNDSLSFTEITSTSGINSSVIGYGLGIAISDINFDGFPDIYIGNDFHENDYLYINNGKGVFSEEITKHIAHTSRFTMGVDIADVNNDGRNEIISMDMLSDDPYTLKRSLGEDDYDIFNLKISYGYQHQYTRNNLQFNRGNGLFSETGLYSGIAATDWSWSPLWVDFDNDGLKDLFISNGIPKRMNDIDYINFISNEEIQRKLAPGNKGQSSLQMIEKFPKIKIENRFFRNAGNLQFTDERRTIGNPKETYSNGAVYADFDNDGDLDVVVNNIDEPALLYRNNVNQVDSLKAPTNSNFISLKLKGDASNVNAVGAKLILYTKGEIKLFEKFPVHGFQSSAENPLHGGIGNSRPDSAILIWPDNSMTKLRPEQLSGFHVISYQKGLPSYAYAPIARTKTDSLNVVSNITGQSLLRNVHYENVFAEFNREPLMPHMLSTEGPALAVGDMNGDGLDDVFIGAARSARPSLWLQMAGGQFRLSNQPGLVNDSIFEDVSACWADVNNDGRQDLIVASGGNEFYGKAEQLLPRVYINDGEKLTRKSNAISDVYGTKSVVIANDFNGDGFIDLFIGGRAVPMEYGKTPQSYLLQNDGTGLFRDVTATNAPGLADAGFVTSSVWSDIDRDGDMDLLISLEWGELIAYINNGGKFSKQLITTTHGWWNFLLPCDVDNDGDIDLIAGNLGLNSRLNASEAEPVNMYYYDFDDNGRKEQILTYYLNNKQLPFASIGEISKQIPLIKKKFLYAGDFAAAELPEIFGKEKLEKAQVYSATNFANAVFINDGNLKFTLKPLPWEAQLSPYRDAVIVNANNDSLPDILLVGNYFDSNTEMGRYDADPATLLINKGGGTFNVSTFDNAFLKGQVRHVAAVKTNGKEQVYVLPRNNDSTVVLKISGLKIW